MKRAIALVTESTRRDGTRQGFAAPRPVGAPLTEPAPPPKKDRLRGRCPSESSPGSRAPNPDAPAASVCYGVRLHGKRWIVLPGTW